MGENLGADGLTCVQRKAVNMAAGRTLVDLRAVATGCEIPYSTLARWAVKRGWVVYRRVGHRRLYSWEVVSAAVAEAMSARQERDAA
jgi:hypothetical protein